MDMKIFVDIGFSFSHRCHLATYKSIYAQFSFPDGNTILSQSVQSTVNAMTDYLFSAFGYNYKTHSELYKVGFFLIVKSCTHSKFT